jgi:cyclohexyl-isocyanide hydratase
MTAENFTIGLLLFPRLTQLDMTGPFEVFKRLPGAKVHLIWKTLEPVHADSGLGLLPTTTIADCPALDIICVPGGPGVGALMEDEVVLSFLRKVAADATYVTSVCTGALVLGAAGLLKGKRATTHWMSRPLLKAFGAEPIEARVVTDGKVVTGGGVTAGIDFGLTIAGAAFGPKVAEQIQLSMEYDPHPPFDAGSPRTADPAVTADARARGAARQKEREAIVERVAARLG